MKLTRTLMLLVSILCIGMAIPCLLSAETSSEPKSPAFPRQMKHHRVKGERDIRTFHRHMKHLHFKSESASPEYYATERIIVRFELKNESKTPMRVLLWGTPFEGFNSDMFEITKDGVEIPYRGKMVSRSAPTDNDYIILKENESITRDLDLSEAYHILEDGKYVLNHRTSTLEVDLHKEQGASSVWRPQKAKVAFQPVTFKQKGIRQKKAPTLPEKAPSVRPPFRMYAQAPSHGATDQTGTADTRKCNLNDVKLPEYDTANNDRKAALNEAFCEALQMAAESKVLLNGAPEAEIEKDTDRYDAYFGDADKKDVLAVFRTIYTYGLPAQETSVTFHDVASMSCKSSDIAFVMGDDIFGGHKIIYLCPLFWTLTDPRVPKSGTILHEMAHLTRGAVSGSANANLFGNSIPLSPPGEEKMYRTAVWDYLYLESGCMYLAQSDCQKAAFNADSYARFAMNRNNFSTGLDRPYVRLSNASGESLVVEKNALMMRSKPDPVRSIFALSNPRESKLIYPAAVNNACKDLSTFMDLCEKCDDPDMKPEDAPDCYTESCNCLVKIDEKWKTYSPVSGDQVLLVSSDGASVATPPGTPGGPVRVEAATANSWLKLIKTNTVDSQLRDGDEVVLQTAQGLYLSASDNGSVIASRSDQPGGQEKFTVSFSNQERFYVQFRSRGNRYVSIYRRFSGIGDEKFIAADEKAAAECANCTFVMVNKNGPGLKDGDAVYLMAKDGRGYVAAINERTSGFVEIDSTNTGIPQVFTIKKDNPSGDVAIRTGDVISLVTESGNVVRTGPGGTGQLYASYVGTGQVNENIQMKFIIELGR